MSLTSWSRSCIDMQGYRLSQAEKARLDLAIRFAPGVCAVLAATFSLARWPLGLYGVAAVGAIGALLPRHPFDLVYAGVLAPLLRTAAAPPSPPQRRFACAGAALMLAPGAWLIGNGQEAGGVLLGLTLASVAAVVATTHWCLPSFIYNRIPGAPGRV